MTSSPQLPLSYPSIRESISTRRTIHNNVAEEEFNWSQLDTLLTSDQDSESISLSESIRYKRAWFLLIPIPTTASTNDTENSSTNYLQTRM